MHKANLGCALSSMCHSRIRTKAMSEIDGIKDAKTAAFTNGTIPPPTQFNKSDAVPRDLARNYHIVSTLFLICSISTQLEILAVSQKVSASKRSLCRPCHHCKLQSSCSCSTGQTIPPKIKAPANH
jgi:hypothetical protein